MTNKELATRVMEKFGAISPETAALGRLLHGRNKALEFLKRVSENAEGLLGRDGEYLVDDETYALIKELEEVST